MAIATVTSKGQVTIPKAVRDFLHVDAGDEIDFVVTPSGDVLVRTAALDVRELRGLLASTRRKSVSVEQMNAAILRRHASKK
jgi:AbrB family looped-hinge helix DNA binding protein